MSYNGARYSGYQLQPNNITVQGAVEEAFYKILGVKTEIIGCSRTDAGVSAREFCFNMRINGEINTIPCDNLVKALNSVLPPDIAIISCAECSAMFHARFDAKGKEYLYLINNGKTRDVFKRSFHYPFSLDAEKLNETAKLFVGEHDFGAFCKAESKKRLKSAVREVYGFNVNRNGDFVSITVSGSGFLHNMVRIMAGTLIYVAEGKRTESDIIKAFSTKERALAGKTLPPEGLYLNKVFY